MGWTKIDRAAWAREAFFRHYHDDVPCFYSMNATAEQAKNLNYRTILWSMEDFLTRNFQRVEVVSAFDTYQFQDYGAYQVAVDLERKTKQREIQFPTDLDQAKAVGKSLAELALKEKA